MPPAEKVSDRVHDRLRGEILDGRLAPGDPVPSERVLAEQLGVNRHAVREALKRLEQAGLVKISQGGATRVQDWRQSGGLEIMLDVMHAAGGPPPAELARAVLEMRASIGTDSARRCCTRASAAQREEIAQLAQRCADAIGDDAVTDETYAQMWLLIVDGAQNIAYRLALNSLLAALAAYEDLAMALLPTDPAPVRALGDAIASGDAPRAVAASLALLEPA